MYKTISKYLMEIKILITGIEIRLNGSHKNRINNFLLINSYTLIKVISIINNKFVIINIMKILCILNEMKNKCKITCSVQSESKMSSLLQNFKIQYTKSKCAMFRNMKKKDVLKELLSTSYQELY